jgi:hypothetical protein
VPTPLEVHEYEIAAVSLARALAPEGLLAFLMDPAFARASGIVSISPRVLPTDGGRKTAKTVLGFDRPINGGSLDPSLGALFAAGLPAYGRSGKISGRPNVPFALEVESRPRRQDARHGARPVEAGCAVSPVRPNPSGGNLFGTGGTLGAFVEVDGRWGLVSCTHVIGHVEKGWPLPDVGDLVIEPATGYSAGLPSYTQDPKRYAIAELARWTLLTDKLDLAFAYLLDPPERYGGRVAEPEWQPATHGAAIANERVRLCGARSGKVEGHLVSSHARVFDDDYGVWFEDMLQYARPDAALRWQAITAHGDSGAVVLQGDPPTGVGLHVLAGREEGDERSSYSYAHPMEAVLGFITRQMDVETRRGIVSLPALLRPRVGAPARLSHSSSVQIVPCPVGPGSSEESMAQVVYNIHICGPTVGGPAGHPGAPQVPSTTLRALGRQAFTRFARVRFHNLTPPLAPNGKRVTAVHVTPIQFINMVATRGTPVNLIIPPGFIAPERGVLAVVAGATAPDQYPNQVEYQYTFADLNGANAVPRGPYIIDLSAQLPLPGATHFIQEVDVEFEFANNAYASDFHVCYTLAAPAQIPPGTPVQERPTAGNGP